MGRPRIYQEPRVATAVRLPRSVHGQLHALAEARDVSVNFLVTSAVSEYLRRPAPLAPEEPAPRRPRRREAATGL